LVNGLSDILFMALFNFFDRKIFAQKLILNFLVLVFFFIFIYYLSFNYY
jgi:hypothetical protein